MTGRDLGRWGLAAVAAVAGLAYGALLDLSVMVQYGGEQSLDRYLALSARGIPFNIAHALGNAALMLAAGPAMVRMLGRYRERFDVAWRDAPLARSAAAVIVALCLVLPLLAAPPAVAGDDAKLKEKEKALAGLAGARSWLLGAQNDDGGFGAFKGDDSSPGMTGWAMLGLQAAGMNPRDATLGGKSPVQYLRSKKKKIKSTGDLERTILALDGAELNARDFDGADLVERLRHRQRKDGSFERQVNLTAFGILAQRAAGVEKGNVGKAAKWLRSVQNKNGGWGSVEDGASEPDSTGAALQALAVSPGDDQPIKQGAKWLERNQHGDGGWSLTVGADTNSQSTAWAIQGLEAAGRNAAEIREDGSSGLDYLRRRQDDKGFYMYSTSSDQTPVWVTAQAMTGTAREPYPIAPVELAAPETDDTTGNGDDPDDLSDVDTSGGYDSGYDSGYSGGYDGSYDPYDYGGSGASTGSGSGSGSSSGSGFGSGSTGPDAAKQGIPGDPVPAPDEGAIDGSVSELASPAAEPIPTELLAATGSGSPLPETNRMLAGLGLLALLLAAGFFWYRRRLP